MNIPKILLGVTFFISLILGLILGTALAAIRNFEFYEEMDARQSPLPTRVYDIKGRLITEFYSDENREIIALNDMPVHLLNAIVTREDQDFYNHPGYSIKGIIRAAWGYFTFNYQGGGSTLTIQVAGHRYADRTEYNIGRKLVELWYAMLLEKRYSKNEILAYYLNEMPFGGGTNGVETASKYYFNKSVTDITLAESVLLVNILSSHTTYSPLKNPEIAKERQRYILDEMVELGYATQEEADFSFNLYWLNYDYTRNTLGDFFNRHDEAPWFSEYVRSQLEDELLGSQDIYRSGLNVYTTLDLDYQKIADEIMIQYTERANNIYKEELQNRVPYIENTLIPLTNFFALTYDISGMSSSGTSIRRIKVLDYYHENINPVVDIISSSLNLEELRKPIGESYVLLDLLNQKTQIQGALISIDSHNGQIRAMVGGNEFTYLNQFNRATIGELQPGSSFKPLYYSEAINSKMLTASSILSDSPVAFPNDDGTLYTPLNYIGDWYGLVTVRQGLALSLNIPSLRVLDTIGFDAAINRASLLLGISDPAEINRRFPRKYPLGLGVTSVSPLQMARAFATFVNQGVAVDPIAILYVEDRNGNIILNPEQESIKQRMNPEYQVLTPQAAYIMTQLLSSTVDWGTLIYGKNHAGGFDPDWDIAGKTGTTQNWADGWAVGFTNDITTAIWFGFDTPGNSLGRKQAGANVAGFPWAVFMKTIHEEMSLEAATFVEPDGIVYREICTKSGLLPDPDGYCEGSTRLEVFISGTQPWQYGDYHRKMAENKPFFEGNVERNITTAKTTGYGQQNNTIDMEARLRELGFDMEELTNPTNQTSDTEAQQDNIDQNNNTDTTSTTVNPLNE